MAEAVKVVVRCRPMNQREHNLKCKEVLNISSSIGQCAIKNPNDAKAPPKTFTFDGAYDTTSTTEQIYADIGYPLVEGVTEGYNGTIFAYGQTGCGKSFSMQGITDPVTQRGIIPRAFDHIFETIQVSEDTKYLVHASYLEIYNEEVRDLLGKDNRKRLELKEHPDKGVYVQGLSMHPCACVKDCSAIMDRGWKQRSVGATLMNAESSRSHSIFTIYLERCEADDKGEEHIRAAKLNLVDLAGSERQAKTGSTGDRLKEATKINLSLSALGNVISALVDGKSKHIPYRDSKLTRLLQDSLGGNTKTLMVACLSPADNNYDETLSTLRYANRAKNIKNKPKINEDPKDALLREYQQEINKLKMMLRGEIPVDLDGMGGSGGGASTRKGAMKEKVVEKVVHVKDDGKMEEEKARIKEEYEQKMQDMRQEFEEMKMSKEMLQKEMSNLQDQYNNQMASVEQGVHVSSPGQRSQRVKESHAETANDASDDAQYTMQQEVQRAIHLATVKTIGEAGTVAPRSSPTSETQNLHHEALRRLQELQQQMVGGEQANNEEVKQRRQKKKRHVEERKKKLQEALARQDGEEIMLDIYENVQEELKVKDRLLKKTKEKVEVQQREIADLQEEFEYDRNDYLDTIRKQEQEMKWLRSVIDKIHPCLRRDSNYVNLDRIRAHSQWDGDNQCWIMPKMTIEKTKLPPAGVSPGGRQPAPEQTSRLLHQMNDAEDYEALKSEERYLQRLSNSTEQEMANNYFRPKRAERLLSQAQQHEDRSWQSHGGVSTRPDLNGPMMNGSPANSRISTSSDSWEDNLSATRDQLRAAQVHGQISQYDETAVRKPTRLESLPAGPSAKGKRKKSRQMNMMEHF